MKHKIKDRNEKNQVNLRIEPVGKEIVVESHASVRRRRRVAELAAIVICDDAIGGGGGGSFRGREIEGEDHRTAAIG